MLELVSQWGSLLQSYEKKADYITKNLEENGIFYALEELNMVEKELTLPQLGTCYD